MPREHGTGAKEVFMLVVHEPSGVGNTNGILEENMKGRL